MRLELFDTQVPRSLVKFLKQQGVRPEPFLDEVRIPLRMVVEGGWFSKKQAYDLARNIVQKTGRNGAVFPRIGILSSRILAQSVKR